MSENKLHILCDINTVNYSRKFADKLLQLQKEGLVIYGLDDRNMYDVPGPEMRSEENVQRDIKEIEEKTSLKFDHVVTWKNISTKRNEAYYWEQFLAKFKLAANDCILVDPALFYNCIEARKAQISALPFNIKIEQQSLDGFGELLSAKGYNGPL